MIHLLLNFFLGAPSVGSPVPVRRDLYVRRFLAVARLVARRRFSRIDVAGSGRARGCDGPLVLYANHPGFWDPVVCGLMSQALFPKHHIYAPIDREALKTHWYFNGLGFFGIQKNSVAGLRDLRKIGSAILTSVQRPILIVTPEGEISSPDQRPTRLKKGLSYLIGSLDCPRVTIFPLALRYQNAESRDAVAWAQLGQPLFVEPPTPRKQLQLKLETSLEKAMLDNDIRLTRDERGISLLEETL